ncbi:MAG: hypothetical protein AXA67_09400 [Methylothermaceae bacteria B42]|nr:MAG: hypothetical protein AXA67_09400 [Methylothermaceae bacteria B42]HHJ39521.1 Rrf2 family transcriptional regulator [Methylothermaceae bacterium]
MQLTRFTDYAFRLLMYLAQQPERDATISEVAGYFGISRHHLVKVVNHLGRCGFIETSRGKGGGLKLSQNPAAISLGDVIRKMEPNLALVECRQADYKNGDCRLQSACVLNSILDEALEAFLNTLDRYSLADAVRQGGEEKLIRFPKKG